MVPFQDTTSHTILILVKYFQAKIHKTILYSRPQLKQNIIEYSLNYVEYFPIYIAKVPTSNDLSICVNLFSTTVLEIKMIILINKNTLH